MSHGIKQAYQFLEEKLKKGYCLHPLVYMLFSLKTYVVYLLCCLVWKYRAVSSGSTLLLMHKPHLVGPSPVKLALAF
jgi:hypothetical protein